MATILSFAAAAKRSSSAAPKRRTAGASIIIFPGVRYERRPDGGPDTGGDDRPHDVRRRSTKG
ncbi:hypothetical protein [Nitratireductor rhodophyticola]|uniref:hypothetical protein n=1 Tax=Nitratireductor rhodophyticola TaxID=2854036 RepID=UPI002ECB3915|nr:hypothetical protein [Pseudomonadota bacterium]